MNHQDVLNIPVDSGTSEDEEQQPLESEEADPLFVVLKGKAIATVALKAKDSPACICQQEVK
jgi:hypothetical protein